MIYKDTIDQYIQILETLKKRSAMAIHDDRAAQASQKGGKLLLVDPADYGTQHIFFDDSAYEGEACQVDVVDAVSGSKLEYKNVIGKYVVKVEPQRAIMEADYFVKLIDAAEQKRSEEIERVEMGGTEEETLHKKAGSGKEWEKL